MSDDIVTRLREHADDEGMLGNDLLARCLWDSADEIERARAYIRSLERQIDSLRCILLEAGIEV